MSLDPTSDSNYDAISRNSQCSTIGEVHYLIKVIERTFVGGLDPPDRFYLRFFKNMVNSIDKGEYQRAYKMFEKFFMNNMDDLKDSSNFKIFWMIAKGIISYLKCLLNFNANVPLRAGEDATVSVTDVTYARTIIDIYNEFDGLFSGRSSQSQTFVPDTSGGGGSASATSTSGGGGGSASATSTSGGGAGVVFVDDGLDGMGFLDDSDSDSTSGTTTTPDNPDIPLREMSTEEKIQFFLSRAKFYYSAGNMTELANIAQKIYNRLIFALTELQAQVDLALESSDLETIGRARQNLQMFYQLNTRFGFFTTALANSGTTVSAEVSSGFDTINTSLGTMDANLVSAQVSAAQDYGSFNFNSLLDAWGQSPFGGSGGSGSV